MRKCGYIGGAALAFLGLALLIVNLRPDLLRFPLAQAIPWPLLILGFALLALGISAYSCPPPFPVLAASIAAAAALRAYQLRIAHPADLTFLWPLVPAFISLASALAARIRRTPSHSSAMGLSLALVSLLSLVVFYAMRAANLNMHLTWAFVLLLTGAYLWVWARTGRI